MIEQSKSHVMDKEAVRQLVLQAASFLRLFGGAYPRLNAISALLTVEAEPAVWDTVWAAIQANPAAMTALADSLHHAQADFKGLGNQSEHGGNFLSFVTATGDRGADYYQTKAAISGIIMAAYGFAGMTRNTRDDVAVRDLMEMFTAYFDQFWDHQHGGKK